MGTQARICRHSIDRAARPRRSHTRELGMRITLGAMPRCGRTEPGPTPPVCGTLAARSGFQQFEEPASKSLAAELDWPESCPKRGIVCRSRLARLAPVHHVRSVCRGLDRLSAAGVACCDPTHPPRIPPLPSSPQPTRSAHPRRGLSPMGSRMSQPGAFSPPAAC